MFVKIVVPVGFFNRCSSTIDNGETCVLLAESANCNYNEELLTIHSRGVVFCEEDKNHGVENIWSGDLVFVALIVDTK